jgi:hypothetical protein
MFDLARHERLGVFQKNIETGSRAKVNLFAMKLCAGISRWVLDESTAGGFVAGGGVEGEHLVIGNWRLEIES